MGEAELSTVGVAPTNGHMNVGMGRIVVLDRNPLEAAPEVSFDGCKELARMALQVQPVASLGRDDELPDPRIAGALPRTEATGEVESLARSVEAEPRPIGRLRALASEVAPMRSPLASAAVPQVADLYDAPLELGARSAEVRETSRATASSTSDSPTR